jgi:uncharacterized protein (TIGR01777 family)
MVQHRNERRILVAGGTGLVGRHLAAALVRGGLEVTVLSRSGRSAILPAGAEGRPWEALPEVLERAAGVVNLCGEGIADARWSPGRKRTLLDSRVGPTRRLVEALAAARNRPSVLVSASAVGVYGPMDVRPVTEADPPGAGFLADVGRAWEAAAALAASQGVRVVQLRLGMVLARDGGALPRMARPARYGLASKLGGGHQGMSWIHVDDLVSMILAALADPRWHGPVNATAPGPVSNEAFTRALCRHLRRPLLPAPAWLTRAGLRILLGEMGEAMLLQGAYVLPAKAQALGFRFRFPDLDGALTDLLGEERRPTGLERADTRS